MSNRRRPQWKQEVNIKLSRYVTLCISFIEQNATCLMRAVSRNYIDIVKLLIEKGADVNAKNDWDYTPLKYTQKLNLKEMEQILTAAGAT